MRFGSSPEMALMDREADDLTGHETFDEKIVGPLNESRPRDVAPADRRQVERLQERFGRKSREGQQLMYSVAQGVDSWDWLGPDAHVVMATEYDDVVNGVDFIVVFRTEDGRLVKLGVDVTCAEDVGVLNKKIDRVGHRVGRSELSRVKYFNFEGEHGPQRMPHVIIGTNAAETKKLFADFVGHLTERKGRERIAEHHLQLDLIREARHQLHHFLEKGVEGMLKAYRTRDLPVKDQAMLAELEGLLKQVKPMSSREELTSVAFPKFLKLLERNRSALYTLQAHLGETSTWAETITRHLDVIKVMANLTKKEKSSAETELKEPNLTVRALVEPKPAEQLREAA